MSMYYLNNDTNTPDAKQRRTVTFIQDIQVGKIRTVVYGGIEHEEQVVKSM